MNFFFVIILIFITSFSNSSAIFASPADPKGFIENLGKEAIHQLTKENADEKDFIILLDEGFDIEKILKRIVTEAVWAEESVIPLQECLLALYKSSLSKMYLNQFKQYGSNVQFQVNRSILKGSKAAIVESTLQQKQGSSVTIDWDLSLDERGQWRIVDVLVGSISMISNQVEVYQSILKRNPKNVPLLIEKSKEKTGILACPEPAKKASKSSSLKKKKTKRP